MTFKELKEFLNTLNEEQLECTATVYDTYEDEYMDIISTGITSDSDVLDENHPYLILKA